MKLGIHDAAPFPSSRAPAEATGRPQNVQPNHGQLEELVLQLMELEWCSVDVFRTASLYARSNSLKQEWRLASEDCQTQFAVLGALAESIGIDPQKQTPGRIIVRHLGVALVEAMNMSVTGAHPATTELVASECVLLAATKAQFGWELLARCIEAFDFIPSEALRAAYFEVANSAKDKFFSAHGRCRRAWLASLGASTKGAPWHPEEDE